MRILKRTAVALILLVGAAGIGYALAARLAPKATAGYLVATLRAVSGLEVAEAEITVNSDPYQVGYLDSGDGAGLPVVLLHGVFARKEHWIDFSRQISSDRRVIAPDLPGFGDNALMQPALYAYEQQAEHVIAFLDALGLYQVHLGANSMGGQIAGHIATRYPERVASVAFIGSPVGVPTDPPSEMEQAIAAGHAPLLVQSEADFEARMEWLFPKAPFMPAPVLQTWAKAEAAQAEANAAIWQQLWQTENPPLIELTPDIAQPSLVIWCKEDRIFHPKGAKLLQEALPNGQADAPRNCGHLPMLDKPAPSGKIYAAFLAELP